ncbi:MAG: hypothetical protein EZS28_049592, partial [Streblomastix strix]
NGGNGGGVYFEVNFAPVIQIKIQDTTIHDCEAITNSSSTYPQSGFGGGIFLSGSNDYDQTTDTLDFSGMLISGNTAGRSGQSMYVAMTKVKEWCKKGTLGEFVKGNYNDETSDESELEGIPLSLAGFNSQSQSYISDNQRHLEYYWDSPRGQIWHILNKYLESLIGINKPGCAEFDNPCNTIAYAILQISIEKGSSADAIIPEKKIGIHQGGYDLTAPYQFSKSNSYTDCVKIMKQLYGTTSVMEDQAELKIIKGSSGSAVESGNQGWISAIEGIQLRIYGIKIVTDDTTLLIPIIYIEGETSVLELNTVTLTGIDYISPSNPDDPNPERFIRGLIHIDVDDSIFIASGCLFKDINIDSGGNTIRIH